MNYERIYAAFIASRRSTETALKKSGTYFEQHHVIPRAFGGAGGSNIIRLSARDHYFAHCCLAKIYGGKMWSALFAIANMTKTSGSASYFLRGRMVAIARVMAAKVRSGHMTGLWESGKFIRNRIYGPLSQEIRDKISIGNLGRKMSQESKDKTNHTKQAKAKRFLFFRVETNEMFAGTSLEFQKHSGAGQSLTSCLTRGKIIYAKGWMLKGANPKKMLGRDPVVRKFLNDCGDSFTGTTYDFRTKYDLDCGVISNLIHGKNSVKSFKGWRYAGEA